ncbi:hypothetical protein GQ457_05G010050 [Hibiscus cannabinus]
MKHNLATELGFNMMDGSSKYLGLPSIWGQGKKEALKFIEERVRIKLQGWKGLLLSQAGKEVLIKAVATAIPSYVMQCFLLPSSFCDTLNAIISRFWWGNSIEPRSSIHWLKWEKMCLPKDEGGMGFKDLYSFNKALIAKQTWRILKTPERILKGIYFSNGNIFKAQPGHNPSWAWRSILSGIDVIKLGAMWSIGNGKNTLIWDDRWIPGMRNLAVETARPERCDVSLVAHLFCTNERKWNVSKLQQLFSRKEVCLITAIPIAGHSVCDEFVWIHNKSGEHSVKSGYRAIMDSKIDEASPGPSYVSSQDTTLWRSVWNLKVPPKIRNFVWKVCKNIAPTKDNLVKRFVPISPLCGRCCTEVENIEHVLFFCPYAQAVWRASEFSYSPQKDGFPGFARWWLSMLSLKEKVEGRDWINLIAFLCWFLWKARNEFSFSNVSPNPIDTWCQAERAFTEYMEANAFMAPITRGGSHDHECWVPPSHGWIKINCDASRSQATKFSGIAALFRNHEGRLVGGSASSCFTNSVDLAEAYAIRMGVLDAVDKGFKSVIIESDNQGLINRLSKCSHSMWETAPIEKDIIASCSWFEEFSFSFVKRSCNLAADWVAKSTRMNCCPSNWVSCPPSSLLHLL